ncbi:uncharacterized protein BDV17DRAFT_39342 [Aspergillus undulatus]|uniref:uncharacterized protein n=1 Tax=Aspergillus undulatus TaxID=1810928 RepID=UPI003CCDEC7C
MGPIIKNKLRGPDTPQNVQERIRPYRPNEKLSQQALTLSYYSARYIKDRTSHSLRIDHLGPCRSGHNPRWSLEILRFHQYGIRGVIYIVDLHAAQKGLFPVVYRMLPPTKVISMFLSPGLSVQKPKYSPGPEWKSGLIAGIKEEPTLAFPTNETVIWSVFPRLYLLYPKIRTRPLS